MNITLFFWPGYRLLVFMLVALNVWSWRFVLCKLGDFSVSMSALRLRRELQESLERATPSSEQAVHEATKEVTIARIAAEDASAANQSSSPTPATRSAHLSPQFSATLICSRATSRTSNSAAGTAPSFNGMGSTCSASSMTCSISPK